MNQAKREKNINTPNRSNEDGGLPPVVVPTVAVTPGDGPVTVHRDGYQREDGAERHAEVEENPNSAHHLNTDVFTEQNVMPKSKKIQTPHITGTQMCLEGGGRGMVGEESRNKNRQKWDPASVVKMKL